MTTANDSGVWAADADGNFHLLIREGQTMAGGKILKSFAMLSAVPGSPGVTRSFNSAGELIWRVQFTNGSIAIILTKLPTLPQWRPNVRL